MVLNIKQRYFKQGIYRFFVYELQSYLEGKKGYNYEIVFLIYCVRYVNGYLFIVFYVI